MKPVAKVAVLSSIISAALVYVLVEWRPLRSQPAPTPEVGWAATVPTAAVPAEAAPADPVTPDERNNIEVYQQRSSGVVNITTTTLAYDFFLRPVTRESGSGSGAIIDTNGNIVTNYHVVEGARRLLVTLADKSRHEAKVVGADPNNDLAVIRIQAPAQKLTPMPLGTSKGLLVGQKVLAIGNPYGLERTLTTGIISSLGRSIQAENGRVIEDIIQTDAAINPGNSGGPLLNTKGEIIGINTAILSPANSGNIGIGFAIPVDTVRRITSDLITLGRVPRPYLGTSTLALGEFPGLADALSIDSQDGLLVTQIIPGSPASKSGLRAGTRSVLIGNYEIPVGGDVILSINGTRVTSQQELTISLERHKPGDRVTLQVLRSNRPTDIPVTLEERPQQY